MLVPPFAKPRSVCGAPSETGRRVRPRGTTVPQGVDALLEELFPCGLVHRSGVVAGAWFTRRIEYGGARLHLCSAWRDEAGSPKAAMGDEAWARDLVAGTHVLGSRSYGDDADGRGFGAVVEMVDGMSRGWDLRSRVGRTLDSMAYGMTCVVQKAMPRARVDVLARARAHVARMGAALAPFLATLDPDALSFGREADWFVTASQVWDGMDGTFAPTAPLRRVVTAHPALASALVDAWSRDRERLAASAGMASADAILSHVAETSFEVPRAAARAAPEAVAWTAALGGTLPDVPDRGAWLMRALALLSDVPPDWVPKGPDWALYLERGASTLFAARRLAVGPRRDWTRGGTDPTFGTMLDVRGRWGAWHAALTREAGGTDVPKAVNDVLDVARALASQVLAPAVALSGVPGDGQPSHDDLARAAFHLLFSGRRLRRMVAASTRWHKAAPGTSATLSELPGDVSRAVEGWDAGLPDHREGDLSVVVLTDAAGLADEGRDGRDADGVGGLCHCVGGYVRDCRLGRSRILSVRRHLGDGAWERVSTVEVDVRGDAVGLAQHRGRGNAEPSPEAADLVARYLRDVAVPDALDRAALAPHPEGEVTGAGYAWRRPGNWEVAVRLWRPLLPRALRDATLRDWAALATRRDLHGGPWRPDPVAVAGARP